MREMQAAIAQLRRVVAERPGAVVAVRPRELDLAPQVGQAVLEGLERGDRAAERVAAVHELLGDLEGALGAAELLEGHEHGRAVENPVGQGRALTGVAEPRRGCALEADLRQRAGRIERADGGALHAVALEIHQHQAHAAALLRGDHREARHVAVGYRQLRARELAALEGGLDALGRVLPGLLGEGEGADGLAGRELRQVLLLLLIAARLQDRLGGEVDARGERNRRQRAAELLGDHGELEIPEAGPAVLLGNHAALVAHLGGRLQERLRSRADRIRAPRGRRRAASAPRGSRVRSSGGASGPRKSRSSWGSPVRG